MINVDLKPDEAVLVRVLDAKFTGKLDEDVAAATVESKDMNAFKSIANKMASVGERCYTGNLILTNARLLFACEIGSFSKKVKTFSRSVTDIKVYNGLAQVRAYKLSSTSRDICIDFEFADGSEQFVLPIYDRAERTRRINEAQILVESVNKLLIGEAKGFNPEAVGVSKSIREQIHNVLGTAKPIAQDVAEIASPFADIVSTVTTPKTARVQGVANIVTEAISAFQEFKGKTSQDVIPETENSQIFQGQASGMAEATSAGENQRTLDEQIDAVKKLKELLDVGILSQEEFDVKKRQIMNL